MLRFCFHRVHRAMRLSARRPRKGTKIKSIKHDVQRRPAGQAASICPSGSIQAGLRPRLLPQAAREKGPGPPKPPPEAGPPRAPEPGEPPRPPPAVVMGTRSVRRRPEGAAAPRAPDAHRAAGAAPLLAARAALCRAELLRAPPQPPPASSRPPARPPRGCAEVRASAAGDLKPRPASSGVIGLSWRAPPALEEFAEVTATVGTWKPGPPSPPSPRLLRAACAPRSPLSAGAQRAQRLRAGL